MFVYKAVPLFEFHSLHIFNCDVLLLLLRHFTTVFSNVSWRLKKSQQCIPNEFTIIIVYTNILQKSHPLFHWAHIFAQLTTWYHLWNLPLWGAGGSGPKGPRFCNGSTLAAVIYFSQGALSPTSKLVKVSVSLTLGLGWLEDVKLLTHALVD